MGIPGIGAISYKPTSNWAHLVESISPHPQSCSEVDSMLNSKIWNNFKQSNHLPQPTPNTMSPTNPPVSVSECPYTDASFTVRWDLRSPFTILPAWQIFRFWTFDMGPPGCTRLGSLRVISMVITPATVYPFIRPFIGVITLLIIDRGPPALQNAGSFAAYYSSVAELHPC